MIKKLLSKVLNVLPAMSSEKLKIMAMDFKTNPPILIYQMGKVGSSTVYNSLKNANRPNPVFHVHFLSNEGIKDAEKFFVEKGAEIPYNLRFSKILRRKIDKNKNVNWKIITLVREPISKEVSTLFQVGERVNRELLDKAGNLDSSLILKYFEDLFEKFDESTDYTNLWFDKEIKRVFNVDIYKYPFDQEKGYTIIHDRNVDLLILRLESLDNIFEEALKDFLNLEEPFKMHKTNIRAESKNSDVNKNVLKNIIIPKNICLKIYSTRYVKHFYSEAIREEFIRKWSKRR